MTEAGKIFKFSLVSTETLDFWVKDLMVLGLFAGIERIFLSEVEKRNQLFQERKAEQKQNKE